jgi:hypothetical protein
MELGKKKCFVLFNRPVVIPEGPDGKLKTYGFLIDVDVPSDMVTFENICSYTETYVLPIVELLEDGFNGSSWVFTKGDRVASYNDSVWKEYFEKSKLKNIRFYVADATYTEYSPDDLFENYWVTSERMWNEMNKNWKL